MYERNDTHNQHNPWPSGSNQSTAQKHQEKTYETNGILNTYHSLLKTKITGHYLTHGHSKIHIANVLFLVIAIVDCRHLPHQVTVG